ncbi:5716_t:CDS:2 [Entrophospora sp. SA101]|nr:5716_t:CDS:2 [Entrophospora sp. SA101]
MLEDLVEGFYMLLKLLNLVLDVKIIEEKLWVNNHTFNQIFDSEDIKPKD